MALTINLYDCELHELQEHVSNPSMSIQTLEEYKEDVEKLIEQQKAQDKAQEIPPSPRSRNRSRRSKSDAFDSIDAISITSSTTSSRPRRTRKSSASHSPRRSRKSSRSNHREDDSDDDDMELDDFGGDSTLNTTRTNSVEYDWFEDMAQDEESSSFDALLNFDPSNLNPNTFDSLLSDKTPKSTKKSSKKKKKKHKNKDKKKKKKKHKNKDKKKKKRKDNDDDYMISTDDDDWDPKQYEEHIQSYSVSQLEKEQKSLERQIETEIKKLEKQERSKEASESETEENLNKLSVDELYGKVLHKLKRYKHREDPSKLYCICREPYDGTTQMICCDYCQEWYHLQCIGLSADKLASVEKLKFKCPVCNGADPTDITNTNSKGASFDSPKSSPNPQHITGPHTDMLKKYEGLIVKLQTRVKECKTTLKKEKKDLNSRLSRAKKDIDSERQRRVSVEAHMQGAKRKSESMVKELGGSLKHQKEKESELVNKLKKLEANKKKYKESASENKKKMRVLKEEHVVRLHELEDEFADKLSSFKKKYCLLEEKYQTIQQQLSEQQQQASSTINSTYTQYNKVQQQLNGKSAEAAKLQNLNSQLQHKMDALHIQAQHNHEEWENIAKAKDDKRSLLIAQITALQQQNNALRSNNNMPAVIITPINGSSITPPSPIVMPVVPGYLKFNDLELEELKMCRELCLQLLEANLFQVEHMAARAQLTRSLFVSWVTGIGKSPTVINDLNQATMGTLPQLDPEQHLSMNCIRLLLIEIRKQLENIASDTANHDSDTCAKVKCLLREFQSASQAYEQKMNEFKRIQHDGLLEGCRSQGSVLEMFCVVGTNDNNEPQSEWIKVTVCNFDGQNNRVLVRKSSDQSMAYAAIDAATLRLSETSTLPILNGTSSAVESYWNNSNRIAMNFNGIPAIPACLPPFNDLQANNIGNQHHISNTINTNNNISINGATTHDPIVIGDEDDNLILRKRKKNKKKKYDSSTESDESSSSDDSDISSDSSIEKRRKKKNKKHKKSSKKKKKKKKKRSRKRKHSRSVSISSTASTRKRRGTKRPLPATNKEPLPPSKKRRIESKQTDYDVIDGGGDSDKNDSVCRICKHPGDLVCCEGCPSAYHADCIRPRVKPQWLDSFQEWYCPSCAPRFSYVPLKQIKNGEKWPQNKEPLLKDLKQFLNKHSFLERDFAPQYHPSKKGK